MQFFRKIAFVLLKAPQQSQNGNRTFTVTQFMQREVDDRKEMLKSLPRKDDGTAGEKLLDLDTIITQWVFVIYSVYIIEIFCL